MAKHVIKNSIGGIALAFISAFNAQAEAIHPLLEFSALTYFSGDLPEKIAATGVPLGNLLGGGAVSTLEAALKQPAPDARIKYFPPKPVTNEAFVSFVTPPASLYSTAAIPLCVGKAGKEGGILWTGKVLTNGRVVADTVLPVADKSTGNPCRVFLDIAQRELQGASLVVDKPQETLKK